PPGVIRNTGVGSAPCEKGGPSEAATTWLTSVHDGAVKCGLGVRRHFAAGRKPAALCPVGGPCFAWVPNARSGRHSREEESSLRSDLGLPWIRTSGLRRLSR